MKKAVYQLKSNQGVVLTESEDLHDLHTYIEEKEVVGWSIHKKLLEEGK